MNSRPESKRRFVHDCDSCVFIGEHDDRDVYFCNQGVGFPTVVLRYGSDGPDYESGWLLRERLPEEMRRRVGDLALASGGGRMSEQHAIVARQVRAYMRRAGIDYHDGPDSPDDVLASHILAALGLDDLGAFAERVAAALPLPQPPAFPKARTASVRRALEAALTARDESA